MEEGLIFLGQHGGYLELPENHDELLLLPYYYFHGNDSIPTLQTIQQELEKYIDTMLPFCLQNFLHFIKQGYTIDAGSIQSTVKFAETAITVDVFYPLDISKGETTKQISTFVKSYPVSFISLHNFLTDFMAEQQRNPEYIPVSFLTLQDAYFINMSSSDEGVVMYELVDNTTFVDAEPYTFSFLFKYDWEIHDGPVIEPLEPLSVHVGETLNYQVNAIGEEMVFDVSHLVDISDDGIISYTALEEDAGEHLVLLTVTDKYGLNATELVEIEVMG